MIKKIVTGFISFIFSCSLLAQPGIQLPYCDNFDGPVLWAADSVSGTPWQLGIPDSVNGFPAVVHSGPNVWAVGLSAPYNNYASTYLVSPKFDFTGTFDQELSFWINYYTEQTWDGARLEFSFDSLSWNTLGSVGDPNAMNWYNDAAINCSTLPGWDNNSSYMPGNQDGWMKAEYSLDNFNNLPSVWFRFHFCSDASIAFEGFAIDDFCIRERPNIDAGIIGISPYFTPSIEGSCNNLIPELKNFGTAVLTQTTIKYSINGSAPVSYVWNGSLLPGATTVIPVGCYSVPQGAHTVSMWTYTPGDSATYNDSAYVDGFGIQIFNTSTCHDFEINNEEFFTFNGGINRWEYGTPSFGVTTGAHSGVNAWDINLTTAYGINDIDTLFSPIYFVDSLLNPTLTFWRNHSIYENFDGYWIEYIADNDVAWTQLGVLSDTLGINWYNLDSLYYLNKPAWDGNSQGWKKSVYFLKNIVGIDSLIRFRFIFNSSGYSAGLFDGVSIDDFCVIHPGQVDASVEEIKFASGLNQAAGTLDTVIVRIRNFGSSNLTATDIYFQINGLPPNGPYQWNGLIPPAGLSGDIYLSNFPITIPAGQFDICAWTNASNDSDASNDTSCRSNTSVLTCFPSYANPYCNDFEAIQADWLTFNLAPTQSTLWELGTPAFGVTTGAYSGTKCWDINLDTSYQVSANTALYSPIFQVPSNGDAILSFYQNRNTELNYDGVRIEYATNYSNTWSLLGGVNAPASVATNWYNSYINCSGMPGWAGNSGGWVQSVYRDLAFLNGTSVRFRFVFCSDPFNFSDGFSIDDFCFALSAPVSVAPDTAEIINPISLYFPGQCYSITTSFTNTGVDSLNDINASLLVDGIQVSSGAVTFNPPLISGAVSNDFTFANCWTATPGTHTICVITSNPNGGMDYNMNDDTLCFTITVLDQMDLTSGNSYCNDFEVAPAFLAVNGLTYSNISTWQYGSPNKPYLNYAYTGTKAWITNLTQLYPANDNSALLTQMFILNTNTAYALQFATTFKTEYMNDGGTFQYSTDYANTWNILGDNNSPQWMNTSNIIALNPTPPPNFSGWSGTSAWQLVQHPVCFPSTQGTVPIDVIFRFLFRSDVFTQDEGWAIDNFCLEPDSGICTVGLNENVLTTEEFSAGIYPNPAKEKLTLAFYIPEDGVVDFVISDITGKSLIHSENIRYQKGMHEIDLQSHGFAPGSYFYSVRWENQTKNGKVIILR